MRLLASAKSGTKQKQEECGRNLRWLDGKRAGDHRRGVRSEAACDPECRLLGRKGGAMHRCHLLVLKPLAIHQSQLLGLKRVATHRGRLLGLKPVAIHKAAVAGRPAVRRISRDRPISGDTADLTWYADLTWRGGSALRIWPTACASAAGPAGRVSGSSRTPRPGRVCAGRPREVHGITTRDRSAACAC